MPVGGNLLLTRADPDAGAAAPRALPFHVHAGPVPTPTAAFADVVLPVCAQWEREGMPDPLLDIHPATAADHAIGEGDWVAVSTASGTVRLRARLDAGMAASVVCGQYGWSRPDPDGADQDLWNIARLFDPAAADPVSGSVTHRGIPCAVVRSGRWR